MTPAAPGGPSLHLRSGGRAALGITSLARSYRHKGELGQVPPRRLSEASRLTIMVVRPRTAYFSPSRRPPGVNYGSGEPGLDPRHDLCTKPVRSPGVRFSILSPGPGVDPFLRT